MFSCSLTHAWPFLRPPHPLHIPINLDYYPEGDCLFLCLFHISFQNNKEKKKTLRVAQWGELLPPTEFMSVSMAVKTQPPGLPHAMDAELEGLWPCKISISGQWFIIATANPFQRAFCLCELQKNGPANNTRWRETGRQIRLRGWSARRLIQKGFGSIIVGRKKKTATQAVGKKKKRKKKDIQHKCALGHGSLEWQETLSERSCSTSATKRKVLLYRSSWLCFPIAHHGNSMRGLLLNPQCHHVWNQLMIT